MISVHCSSVAMGAELDENKVWIDGCFDFTHHGHSGAILQARQTIKQGAKGVLYCGVHDDDAIEHNKGSSPVMNSQERYEHTRANRWCSEVVERAPYVTQPEWMDRYHCKYVVHGDDITLDADGKDCYQLMKDLGRFREVKRTHGVSTTEIIQRILTRTLTDDFKLPSVNELRQYSCGPDGKQPYCYVFNGSIKNEIVHGGYDWDGKLRGYKTISGDFDLFHVGHIEQLGKIRSMPETQKLIVSITTGNKCIMTLKERVLSVLSCKYVDAVVIAGNEETADYQIDDPALTESGKFCYLTKQTIIARIETQRDTYVRRNVKKGMTF